MIEVTIRVRDRWQRWRTLRRRLRTLPLPGHPVGIGDGQTARVVAVRCRRRDPKSPPLSVFAVQD